MNVGEVLLTDRLREKGRRIDAIYTHHPEGMALSKLDRVMEMQAEVWETWGVPINVGESVMDERRVEVRRRFMPMNVDQAIDAAGLLGIPFFSAHTPTDNLVTSFLSRLLAEREPLLVDDVRRVLFEVPEYRTAAARGAGPYVVEEKAGKYAGKVWVDMTGGTEGPVPIMEKLADHGVGTIVGMHMSPELRKVAEDNHIHVVIAGHISSDSVGVNLLLDEYERHGVRDRADLGAYPRAARCGVEADRRLSARAPLPGSDGAAGGRAAGAGRGAACFAGGPVGRRRRRLPRPGHAGARGHLPATSHRQALPAAIDRAHLFGARVLPRPERAAQGRRARARPRGSGSALSRRPRRPDRRRPRFCRRWSHEAYPDLELHASTQLDTHSSAQLGRLAGLGFARAVLARELSRRRDRRARSARPGPRGVHPRRPVLRLLGRLPAVEHGFGAQRQPRAAAARPAACATGSTEGRPRGGSGPASTPRPSRHRRRRRRAASRPVDRRSRRHLGAARAAHGRGHLAQDRGPHEGRGLRCRDHRRLSRGARRGAGRSRRVHSAAAAGSRGSNRASRAASPRRTSRADHAAVRSGGRGGHRGVQVGRVEAVDEAGGQVTVRVRPRPLSTQADVVQI